MDFYGFFKVRPAPLEEDVSESDEEEEEVEEEDDDSDEPNEDDSNDEGEESNTKQKSNKAERIRKKIRERKIRQTFKKFDRQFRENLAEEKDAIVPVFRYLERQDLINCMVVSKLWNGKFFHLITLFKIFFLDWCFDPSLWRQLTVPANLKINSFILIGIVRRQPKFLDLSWVKINDKQMSWLLPRLPQLQSLQLAGMNAMAVSSLHSCNCPLLAVLDLSWIDSLCDDLICSLLSKPPDFRPGLLELKSRLRFLSSLSLAGKLSFNQIYS